MAKKYSGAFKARMVKKMSEAGAVSPYTLAGEVGISESSLYRWKEQAGTVGAVSKRKQRSGAAAPVDNRRRPQDFSPEEKLQVVLEAAGSGNGGILLTDEKFMDFELSIDIKPDWGVCSGLFLRSTEGGQCLQMMVDYHDHGKMGFLYGEGTFGFNCYTFEIHGVLNEKNELVGLKTTEAQSLDEAGLIYSCRGEEFAEAYKIDDWNTARVRVEGTDPHVTTWINDLKICEFHGPTTTNQKYAQNREEIVKLIGQPGSIAVQVHLGSDWPVAARCRWKEILIRTL